MALRLLLILSVVCTKNRIWARYEALGGRLGPPAVMAAVPSRLLARVGGHDPQSENCACGSLFDVLVKLLILKACAVDDVWLSCELLPTSIVKP